MLNHITIMGRLVDNPVLRATTGGTKVASFRIACDRDYTPDGGAKTADFFDVVAWRQTGEFVSKYFLKGKPILVDGRVQMRDWTDKDGNKRRAFEIVAESVYFCGGDKVAKPADPKPADFEALDADDPDCPWNADGDDGLPL